ncbi:MAG: hypothetical protein EXR68_06225 [Dehalococcoidia bacterium]|nr:hypothetical protein [Dehalococcoidia bacterium]
MVFAAFLASAVEAVEALTIVLAVGLTNGWRAALLGVAAASVALAVVVIALGPALVQIVPLEGLHVLIGLLLLIFGMQWIRKAILRATGRKALHDEALIFAREVEELKHGPGVGPDLDWAGFVVSFKGVFLEGLEVAFIVLTFGANRDGAFALSALGAVLAFILVMIVGLTVHRPLTQVPENTIKFVVGVMLVAFGTFWGGEGIGVEWTLGDWMIPLLAAIYAAVAFAFVRALRREAPAGVAGGVAG